MKNKFFLLLISILFIGISCDNGETMQEKLEKERKAIRSFIDQNDFEILDTYPQNGVFKKNQFFRTNDGLYINVVDSGNGRRVMPNKDQVQVRFDYLVDIRTNVKNKESGILHPDYNILPREFIYGNTSSYNEDTYNLACNGWAVPLSYVGENAIVSLIIPSSMAGYYDSQNFNPLFYKNLHYTNFW